jgi:hypothetical protein
VFWLCLSGPCGVVFVGVCVWLSGPVCLLCVFVVCVSGGGYDGGESLWIWIRSWTFCVLCRTMTQEPPRG